MRQCRRAAAALLGVAVGNFAHAAANKSITQYWQSVPTLHEPSNRLQYRKALCLRVFQNDHVLPFLIAQCCIKISIPLMAVPFCQKIPHCATLAVVIFLWQHTTGGVDKEKRPRRASGVHVGVKAPAQPAQSAHDLGSSGRSAFRSSPHWCQPVAPPSGCPRLHESGR